MRYRIHQLRSRRSAFSLVELSMVMAILVTLAAMAMPRYARSMAAYRAATAANRIVNDLQLAQANARASSASQSVVFAATLDRYVIASVKDLETAASNYTVKLADEPYNASISRLDLDGGGRTITFDGFGVPDHGGSIVVVAGSESKTVLVDTNSGRFTVQ